MATGNAKRFIELGVAVPLAIELAKQITAGVGVRRRLIELGMTPREGQRVANLINGTVISNNRMVETGIIPRVLREIISQLGASGSVPVISVAPVVSGATSVGSLLTTTNGTWTNTPTSYAYQWLRGGTPISGATSQTYTVVSADQGTTLTARVTASNASGAGTPAVSNGLAIPGASALVSQYRDDFNSGSTNLKTRAVTGLVTYSTLLESTPGGATLDAFVITTTGKGLLSGSSGQTKAHGQRLPTTVNDRVAMKVLGVGSGRFETHLDQATSGGTPTYLLVRSLGTGLQVRPVIAGVNGTLSAISIATAVAGDILDVRTVTVSGQKYIEVRNNGIMVAPLPTSAAFPNGQYGLAAAGITANGYHSLPGDLSVGAIDWWEGGDPATTSLLDVRIPNHTMPLDGSGNTVWTFEIAYTDSDPAALKYRLWLVTTAGTADTVVAGHDGVPVASFTVDSASKTAMVTLNQFTPTTATTQYYVDVYREDAVDALGAPSVIRGTSPYVMHTPYGGVGVFLGQSLNVLANGVIGGSYSFAAPANLWLTNVDSGRFEYQTAVQIITTANLPINALVKTFESKYGARPWATLCGGISGTSAAGRGVGTQAHTDLLRGLRWTGGKISYLSLMDGQTDENFTLSQYWTPTAAVYADLKARNGGGALLEVINPLGAHQGAGASPASNDVGCERVRRFQAFEAPSLYSYVVRGAFYSDLQHNAADYWHLTTTSFEEVRRREALAYLNFIDPTNYPFDRSGPKLVSASRLSSTVIRVLVAPNGFTSVTAINTAVSAGKTDQFSCGLGFSATVGTSAGIVDSAGNAISTLTGTLLTPTAVSVGALSGGTYPIDFTFTGPLPATVYVRGPFGASPFNLSGNQTVDDNLLTQASMIIGSLAGEPDVAIQPYWNVSRNDYLTAV